MDTETPEEAALGSALSRVGDRWVLAVVASLLGGPRRFGELAGDVSGIATNVLSQRLRHLESEGIVVGRPYSRRPPRVAYELTAAGADLAGVLRMLAQWGADHGGHGGAAAGVHWECGGALEARWYCATCDRILGEDEAVGSERFV